MKINIICKNRTIHSIIKAFFVYCQLKKGDRRGEEICFNNREAQISIDCDTYDYEVIVCWGSKKSVILYNRVYKFLFVETGYKGKVDFDPAILKEIKK